MNRERGLTESIARACARRPWLTIGAWAAALTAAVACLAVVMTGLITEGKGTNNPQSKRAEERMLAAFPPDPSRAFTDLVVVRSDRYTVDDPRFRAFLAALARAGRATTSTARRPPVSADPHAVLLPIFIDGEDAAADAIAAVDRADANPDLEVAITGSETRDHDFNKLSERDLQNGELNSGCRRR
jgi:RND superfamily putative drug exporter